MQFSKNPKRSILRKQGIIANKMASHVFKDSKEVCSMLFFSALKDLQTQVLLLGGTKVGNIEKAIWIIAQNALPSIFNAKVVQCLA